MDPDRGGRVVGLGAVRCRLWVRFQTKPSESLKFAGVRTAPLLKQLARFRTVLDGTGGF